MHRSTSQWLRCLLFVATLAASGAASAHFQNFLGRIVHLEPADGGILIYARLPLAAVLLPGDWQPGDAVPYSRPAAGRDRPDALLLDTTALAAAPGLLREQLRNALQLAPNAPSPDIGAIRIEPIGQRSPFSHLPQVRGGLLKPLSLPARPLPLADAVIDYRAFYPGLELAKIQSLSSNPREWPDLADRTINIVMLHGPDGAERLTSKGPLQLEFAAPPPLSGLTGQIRSGFHHVLIGIDHVLFMLILILAARNWQALLRSSLAFTLGHSITLGLGALGWIATSGWFVPLIETAIALTILYSGACLLLGRGNRLLAGRVFLIGLLHGCGFAFVLHQASGESPSTCCRSGSASTSASNSGNCRSISPPARCYGCCAATGRCNGCSRRWHWHCPACSSPPSGPGSAASTWPASWVS
ncbi:HupE/UreJ family protein [Marinobacterium aestuariivivens]|uniref:HupE/UreJ family protein n=1 Tax=Marinobacterium aestuariivivens TaxID=1698799 RepID=A0ABW2A3X2_9GAMM